MFAEVLRTEKALFFGRYCGEEDGVRRTLSGVSVGAGEFKEDAATGSVIGGAVVDAVASSVGINAQMIVVGSVEDGVFRACGGTGNAGHYIGRVVLSHTALNVSLEPDV